MAIFIAAFYAMLYSFATAERANRRMRDEAYRRPTPPGGNHPDPPHTQFGSLPFHALRAVAEGAFVSAVGDRDERRVADHHPSPRTVHPVHNQQEGYHVRNWRIGGQSACTFATPYGRQVGYGGYCEKAVHP